jgi:Ca2+-binding RTX toxin-like protein
MAIRTVGSNGTYRTISEAMAASGPGDTIQLLAGYSNERATILYSGMIIDGGASSTGIVLDLAVGVTTVTLTGTAPIDVNDAADGNGIVGNDGDNLITVTAGADSASGGGGEDRLFVDYRLATGAVTGTVANVAEAGGGGRLVTINGGFEHYTIWTGAGADTITTGAGDDDIRTGEGAGTVTAGEGFNTIIGGSGADTVTAGDGGNYVDTGDGANNVTTGLGQDEILTGTGADTITSGGGADRITVRGGADNADAGAGDDLLIIDYSASVTDVTGGVTSGNLAAGYGGHIADLGGATLDFVGVERMNVTTGSGNDTVTTGGGNDTVSGNEGNDRFFLGVGGDDSASGGAGDDSFNFGAAFTAADKVDGGSGTDVVQLLGNYNITLAADSFTGIERLTLFSAATPGSLSPFTYTITTADGNVAAGELLTVLGTNLAGDETLVFNGSAELDGAFYVAAGAGNDTLAGGQRGDTLLGGAGNDQLFGLGGDDRLAGGAGADMLRGGNGSDFFVFNAVSDSVAGSMDRIADFQATTDKIDLRKIDANTALAGDQAFTFIGTNAFGGVAGELRVYNQDGHWFVSGDVDGNGTGDLLIQVDTFNNYALAASDFLP